HEVYIETCPHYLTHDVATDAGVLAKVNPPLRERSDRERLWDAVLGGQVDTIATDHVHRPADGKVANIWKATPGFPGVETLLPVMLSEGYHKRSLPLHRIAALLAENPAKIMGLWGKKGAISVGFDADFALVDL